MRIYKYHCIRESGYICVLALSRKDADDAVSRRTSLECKFVESKPVDNLKFPIVIFNTVLPF